MPSVPIYSAPTVTPANLPDVRQQTPMRLMQQADLGPGQVKAAGQGLERAGADFAQAATMDQINTNEAKGKEFDASLMGAHQGILNGTPDDPSSGYLNLKGKAAVDAYQDTVQKIQGAAPDLSQNLDNPAQQKLVANTAALRTQSAIQQATIHYNQQQQVYAMTASKTRGAVAGDGAQQSYKSGVDTPLIANTSAPDFDSTDPKNNTSYQLALQTVATEAKAQAAQLGLDAPTAKEYVGDQLRGVYMGTLEHMLGGGSKGAKQLGPGDLKTAQAYFDGVKGELTTAQQDKVTPLLEAGAAKDKSLDLFFDAQRSGPDYASRIAYVDQQYKDGNINADVHDMALQRVTAANAQARAEQSEQDKATIGQVWDVAHKGGSLATLPPDTLAYIKQRGLGPQVDAIFKRNQDDGIDDSKLFVTLSRMSAENPSDFLKYDLSAASGQLSKGHWNQLVGMQTAIDRQDVRAMDLNKTVHTAVLDARESLKSAGVNMNAKPGTDDAKTADQFESSFRDSVAAAQAGRKDNPLTRQEVRDIATGMLKDQALSGTGYFGTSIGMAHKPVYQMTDEEKASQWEIPAADRQQITAGLQKRGFPASEENIQRAYKFTRGVR